MADKITVIACQKDPDSLGYKTLLSDGREVATRQLYPEGAEYVSHDGYVFAHTAPGADSPAYLSVNYVNGLLRVSVRSQGAQFVSEIDLDVGVEIAFRDALTDRALDADNAMLQARLGETLDTIALMQNQAVVDGNTIATLTRERNEAQDNVDNLLRVRHVAPVPEGLIGVTTARVENLPTIDQMPQHATMDPAPEPGLPESPDQRDVRKHLENKNRLALARGAIEGTKLQE